MNVDCMKVSVENRTWEKPERILKFLLSSSASELSPALLACKTKILCHIEFYISRREINASS